MSEAPDVRELECGSPDLCDGMCDLHEGMTPTTAPTQPPADGLTAEERLAPALRKCRVEDGAPVPLFHERDLTHIAWTIAPVVAAIAEERAEARVAAVVRDVEAVAVQFDGIDDMGWAWLDGMTLGGTLRAVLARHGQGGATGGSDAPLTASQDPGKGIGPLSEHRPANGHTEPREGK